MIKRYKNTLYLTGLLSMAIGISMLGGCATLSKGECLTANWYQIGRNDGARGYERARLYEHREACAEYGVTPRSTRDYKGRPAGTRGTGTPQNGFDDGSSSRP